MAAKSAHGPASLPRYTSLATHLRAIKVVSSRMMKDENFLKRFRNEAVITRKLQHPNTVRVDDIDALEDGRPYIVMELVEGANLRAVVESEGPLPYGRRWAFRMPKANASAAFTLPAPASAATSAIPPVPASIFPAKAPSPADRAAW